MRGDVVDLGPEYSSMAGRQLRLRVLARRGRLERGGRGYSVSFMPSWLATKPMPS